MLKGIFLKTYVDVVSDNLLLHVPEMNGWMCHNLSDIADWSIMNESMSGFMSAPSYLCVHRPMLGYTVQFLVATETSECQG